MADPPREELVRLIGRIMAGEGSEHDDLVSRLRGGVPHPRVVDLIHHRAPPLTAAEVVDRALAYRPLAL